MNPAEIRAIFYAVVSLAMIALGIGLGMHHVQAQWNVDKLSQADALRKQEESIIDLTKQRDDLQNQVGASHAQILANGATLSSGLTDSVRAIEAALRSRPVPGAVGNSSGLQVSIPSSGVDPKLAAAVDGVNRAISSLADSCIKVDADRTSILALEPKASTK